MTLQDIWIDLKIISMLEPTRKLYIVDDVLALEPISILAPLKRWLSNSNRRSVIQRIRQRVEDLETLLKKQDFDDKYWMVSEILRVLPSVKQGLANLQDTYVDDSQVRANIELIVARVDYILRMYENELHGHGPSE